MASGLAEATVGYGNESIHIGRASAGLRAVSDSKPHRPRPSHRPPPRRVVIAGAGVAALETLLALRAHAGARVKIDVLTPGESFAQRPASVAECFDAAPAPQVDVGSLLKAHETVRIVDSLDCVDPHERIASTRSGDTIHYDELVVAIGARGVPAVPGALVFRGGGDVPALRATLSDIAARRGAHAVFLLPPGSSWPLPVYELALGAAEWAARQRLAARFSVVTSERAPLERFGPRAGEAIAGQLDLLGIELRCGATEASFGAGVLAIDGPGGAESLRADRVIALPRLRGPRLAGLPCDADGFIPVDERGRAIGLDGVYAAGDATCGVLKNGALAAAQADAVAELIAERVGATAVSPRGFAPGIRGLLLTGTQALYVRADGAASGFVAAHAASREDGTQRPLWWPSASAAGRHLASIALDGSGTRRARAARRAHAVDLTLLMADCDARCGDHEQALHALDCAEALNGSLPSQYAAKRVRWQLALADAGPRPSHASRAS